MASHPLYSPSVELHEPEIAKPQPLRIIKRSKTISGSTSSGETLCRRRGPSPTSFEQSRGSPPMGADRPLTVYKIRKGRGSVFDRPFDGNSEMSTATTIAYYPKRSPDRAANDDPDITPKARTQPPRTMSAGAFLKSEFYRSSDVNAGRFSVRGTRDSITSSDMDFNRQFPELSRNLDGSPKIPERRLSKSKNFLLRAIGGRSCPDKANPIRRVNSSTKITLIRRISRGRPQNPTPWAPSDSDSASSTGASDSSRVESQDIADATLHSRSSSASYIQTPDSSSQTGIIPFHSSGGALLLSPRITVTPETSSVDIGCCSMWVAIDVHGLLMNVDGRTNEDNSTGFVSSEPMDTVLSGIRRYGYLYSMRIDLVPAHDCFITELIGDLHNASPMRAGETRLILARITLCTSSKNIRGSSSHDLLADLSDDLGGTLTPYLTVQLTYKHSGFLNYEVPPMVFDGMNSHTTSLQTRATAAICRHNPKSAWSPRTSQMLNAPLEGNPLIKLIRRHLSESLANEALRRVVHDIGSIPVARKAAGGVGSSEETVKPMATSISARLDSAVSNSLLDITPSSGHGSSGPFAQLSSSVKPKREEEEGSDPARKIWNLMRQTSRGSRHHARNSVSADHFYSMDEGSFSLHDRSSRDTSSTLDSSFLRHSMSVSRLDGDGVEQERDRIKELALKNKRSVGAETLRSIAPSVAKSGGKGKGGTIGGVGLGVGRAWGWGQPWW